MPSSTRVVGPAQIGLLWAASLGVYLLLRWALLAAYGLPIAGPGLLALTAVLVAASWALIEEPAWASRSAWPWLQAWLGIALLLSGEALIYHYVEGKDRLTPLAFAGFMGGSLCLLPASDPKEGRSALRWGLGVLAALSALLGLWAWADPGLGMDLVSGPLAGRAAPIFAWVLASLMVLGLLALVHRHQPPLQRSPSMPWGREALLLGLVLLAGAAVRLPRMGSLPDGIWYDELNLSRATEDRILGPEGGAPLYVSEQVENPGAYLWVGAAVYKAFGIGITPYRALAAFFGLLALVPFWALARLWFGPRWALAGTLLFGSMRWTLIPQRIGFMSGFALFWMLAAMWALWSARLRGPAGSGSRWRWALAGALAGCNLHTYTPGRLVPVVLLLWLLIELAADARLRRGALPALGAAALGFLLTAGPMLWYIAAHWAIYALRSDQVSIFTDAVKSGRPLGGELWTTLSKHLLMFSLRGDFNARHNLHFYPQVDLVSAAGLALAVPYAVGRFFKDGRGRFLALWIGVMLSAGIFTLAVEAPQGHRTILAAPALALALIWALRDLSAPLGSAFSGGWPQAGKAAALAALLSVAAFNAYEVYGLWGPNSETWRSFSPFATATARRAAAAPTDVEVRISRLANEYQFHGFERVMFAQYFLHRQDRQAKPFEVGSVEPQPLGPPPRALLLIWGESDREISEAFVRQFPDVPVEKPANPYPAIGEPTVLYLAAEVPWQRLPPAGKAPRGFLIAKAGAP